MLGSIRVPLPAQVSPDWHLLEVALPAAKFAKIVPTPNAVMVYIELAPPTEDETELDIDDLEFVEWRQANLMPQFFGHFTLAKNAADSAAMLRVPMLASP